MSLASEFTRGRVALVTLTSNSYNSTVIDYVSKERIDDLSTSTSYHSILVAGSSPTAAGVILPMLSDYHVSLANACGTSIYVAGSVGDSNPVTVLNGEVVELWCDNYQWHRNNASSASFDISALSASGGLADANLLAVYQSGTGMHQTTLSALKSYLGSVVPNLPLRAVVQAMSMSSDTSITTSAPATMDGVTLVSGVSRVLLTGQDSPVLDGIWQFNGTGNAMTRPADFATGSGAAGALVDVAGGTVYHGTLWICQAPAGADVVDSNSLPWLSLAPSVGGANTVFWSNGSADSWSGAPIVTSVSATGYVSIGASPAATGAIRLTNNQSINWRLTGGSDVSVLWVDTSGNTTVNSSTAIKLQVNGTVIGAVSSTGISYYNNATASNTVTLQSQVGNSSFGALYLGAAAASPAPTNAAITGSSTSTTVNAPSGGTVTVTIAGASVRQYTTGSEYLSSAVVSECVTGTEQTLANATTNLKEQYVFDATIGNGIQWQYPPNQSNPSKHGQWSGSLANFTATGTLNVIIADMSSTWNLLSALIRLSFRTSDGFRWSALLPLDAEFLTAGTVRANIGATSATTLDAPVTQSAAGTAGGGSLVGGTSITVAYSSYVAGNQVGVTIVFGGTWGTRTLIPMVHAEIQMAHSTVTLT